MASSIPDYGLDACVPGKDNESAESAMRKSPGCVRAGAACVDIVPIAGPVSTKGARQSSPG